MPVLASLMGATLCALVVVLAAETLSRRAVVGDTEGREVGYIWAAVRNRKFSPAHAVVYIDGEPWFTGDASFVIAGNVGKLLGGIPAFPDASPTDGRLDVGVAAPRRASDLARLFGSVVTPPRRVVPFARSTCAEKIGIEPDRSLPWQAVGGPRSHRPNPDPLHPQAVSICRPRR